MSQTTIPQDNASRCYPIRKRLLSMPGEAFSFQRAAIPRWFCVLFYDFFVCHKTIVSCGIFLFMCHKTFSHHVLITIKQSLKFF